MPNWAENDLIVRGPKKDMEKMVEECFSDEDGAKCPDFNKIVPYPTKFSDMDKAAEPIMDAIMKGTHKGPMPKDGFNSGGYDWCIKNWGTKWDAKDARKFSVSANTLKVTFDTAWSPPKPVILALAKKYPTLEITLKSYEAGMQYKALLKLKGDKVIADGSSDYNGNRGG